MEKFRGFPRGAGGGESRDSAVGLTVPGTAVASQSQRHSVSRYTAHPAHIVQRTTPYLAS